VVWLANGSGIQRSVDGGATFQTVNSMPGASWTALVIDPNNSSHIFAANFLHVYASLDNGATWNIVASGQMTGLLATPLSIFASAVESPTLFLAKLDPALSRVLFSTFIGPTLGDIGIVVDRSGNPVITGLTQSTDFPTTANAFNRTFTSSAVGFAVKVKGDGSALIYSTFLADFFPGGAALDSAGDAVIVGSTQGSAPTTPKSLQPTGPGGCGQPRLFGQLFGGAPSGHGFALKLSPDGTALVWGTFFGGSCGDAAYAVQLDASGNAYITGSTASLDFPVTTGAMTSKFPGLNSSGFISELSADGSRLIYSSFFGAGANNSGNAIALDGSGNVFLGGLTQAKPTAGAVSATHAAGCQPVFSIGPTFDTSYQANDAFVMKMTLSAAPPIFLATLGGSCQDAITSLTLDGAGNLWVAGNTASSDFPTLAPIGAFNAGWGGFVAEIDRTGSNLLFSTFAGFGAVASDANAGVFFALGNPAVSQPDNTTAMVAHIDGGQLTSVTIDSIQTPAVQPPADPPSFFAPAVAPGQLLILKGRNIGPSNPAFAKLGEDGRLPFTLSGAQVLFDGIAAALFSVGANQIECQVPFEVDGSVSTNIQVQYPDQMSNAFRARVYPQQVAILAVSNSDGTLNSASNPASIGSEFALYITGAGQTIPKGIDGGVNPISPVSPQVMPLVYMNSVMVQPDYLGGAPGLSSAVLQLNLQALKPASVPSADTVDILGASSPSQSLVRVYVK
jgi:uncharacterized protein (TIGR03437 family)